MEKFCHIPLSRASPGWAGQDSAPQSGNGLGPGGTSRCPPKINPPDRAPLTNVAAHKGGAPGLRFPQRPLQQPLRAVCLGTLRLSRDHPLCPVPMPESSPLRRWTLCATSSSSMPISQLPALMPHPTSKRELPDQIRQLSRMSENVRQMLSPLPKRWQKRWMIASTWARVAVSWGAMVPSPMP